MTNTLRMLCAIILLTVNCSYAVEGKTKTTSTPYSPPKPIIDTSTGMELVLVKGGCYYMGDTFDEGSLEEKPAHEVCVDDFYMGKTEVTQKQWKTIMGSNPSFFSNCGDNCPVDTVSWKDVQEYISKLNSRTFGDKKLTSIYRLPTEAEWEYAARSGGKSERYSGGDDVYFFAWYTGTAAEEYNTRPTATKAPNGLGLYDMSGNVSEWTSDWYNSNYYSNSPRNNPVGPVSGDLRVVRGGNWGVEATDLRSTYRNYLTPDYRGSGVGFRLLKTTPPIKAK
jgi:formylglycine-generating enzyme required for sulfatase activity